MTVAPNSEREAIQKTISFLKNVDLETITRKSHEKILYDLALHFRVTRSLKRRNHKPVSWIKQK